MAEAAHVHPTAALLFVLTCIVIGIATKYFLSRLPIPYTALLLVFGLCIGLVQGIAHGAHAFTETLSLWMNIDPLLLLLIFLPTIGFANTIDQEPHLLRKNWAQLFILAWPVVVITFLLVALCAKYIFPYGWTWPQALLFGAVHSATDPVAVLAVMRQVGASEKLATVIDGESSLNDGSALVVFLLMQPFVQGDRLSAGEIVVRFLHLALLGAVIGLAFGLVTSFWLACIFNDPCLELVLTFGAAYACHYVAEDLLGASGLLAVTIMGFTMSIIGGRQITRRIKVEMHAFWGALLWLANTILFIWIGVTLGLLLPPKPVHPALQLKVDFSQYLSAADVGWAVVLYLWLLASRAVAIGAFYPLLSSGRVGYALNWREAIVMVWAGLRGVVGVAMSLFVLFDPLISSDAYKAHCVFHMVLMAFATVVINGSTTRYLLKALGLLHLQPQELQVLEHVLQEVNNISKTRAEPDPSKVLGCPDTKAVTAWTHIDVTASLKSAAGKLQQVKANSYGGSSGEAPRGRDGRELVTEYRRRLLHVVKAKYGELYLHFELGVGEISSLQETVDKALDAITRAQHHHRHHHHHQQQQQHHQHQHQHQQQQHEQHPAADPEKPAAGSAAGGLTDWQRLKEWLEAKSWRDGVGRVCRADKLGVPLLQQQAASKLMLVNAFVEAHSAAQQLIARHLEHSKSAAAAAGADSAHCNRASTGSPGSAATDSAVRRHERTAADGSNMQQQQQQQQQQQGEQQDEGEESDELKAARLVLRESHDEVTAALQYAHEVLQPAHPQLAQELMTRYVTIQVLEQQLHFLHSSETAGLVKGEEIHDVQHTVNQRLERLQHAHQWRLPHKAASPNTLTDCSSHGAAAPAGAGRDASGAGARAASAPTGVDLDESGKHRGGGREGRAAEANGPGSVDDFNYTSHLRSAASASGRQSRRH